MFRRRGPVTALPVVLMLLVLVQPPAARADIDPDELKAHTALKDSKAQKKYLQQIEIDKA